MLANPVPLHEKIHTVVKFDKLLTVSKEQGDKRLHVGQKWSMVSTKPIFKGEVIIVALTKTLQTTKRFKKGFSVCSFYLHFCWICFLSQSFYFFLLQVRAYCPADADDISSSFTPTKLKDLIMSD